MDYLAVFDKVSGFFNQFFSAIIILLLGIILARLAQRITLKFMKELEISYMFRKATKLRVSLDNFVSKVVAYLIYIVAIVLFLFNLGLINFVLWIVLGVSLFLLVLGLFIYLISILPNLWAHFKLRHSDLDVGKEIVVGNIKGNIKKISLQFVIVVSEKRNYHIPFKHLLKNKFKLI